MKLKNAKKSRDTAALNTASNQADLLKCMCVYRHGQGEHEGKAGRGDGCVESSPLSVEVVA